jgi:predicted nucleic acid-binding protein
MDLFFDSSALVKRYINETGSTWVANTVDLNAGNNIFVADISAVEITAAIARRTRGTSLAATSATFAGLQNDLRDEYIILQIDSVVLLDAQTRARKHFLRGYDAIQLAVAARLNQRQLTAGLPVVTLVSADTELLDAARVEGLLIENPNHHP